MLRPMLSSGSSNSRRAYPHKRQRNALTHSRSHRNQLPQTMKPGNLNRIHYRSPSHRVFTPFLETPLLPTKRRSPPPSQIRNNYRSPSHRVFTPFLEPPLLPTKQRSPPPYQIRNPATFSGSIQPC
ncbi:hypothetical protein DPMN_141213 [Dreissena polymorpha]|uniref:Uncharacterized protein n=1 Tax=Dreissena polymorpha TaxID=45954 RepID=A0A9D4GBX5_DREPO|nr:hypothetical protein DPMN_141213 [Dreissena polymorpha]